MSASQTTRYKVISQTNSCESLQDSILVQVSEQPEIIGLPENRKIYLCENASSLISLSSNQEDVEFYWSNGKTGNEIEVSASDSLLTLEVISQDGCFK